MEDKHFGYNEHELVRVCIQKRNLQTLLNAENKI